MWGGMYADLPYVAPWWSAEKMLRKINLQSEQETVVFIDREAGVRDA